MKSQERKREEKETLEGVKRGYASDGEEKESLCSLPSTNQSHFSSEEEILEEETLEEEDSDDSDEEQIYSHPPPNPGLYAATDPTLSASTITPNTTPTTTPSSTPPRARPLRGKKPRSKTSLKARPSKRSSRIPSEGAYAFAPPPSSPDYVSPTTSSSSSSLYAAVEFTSVKKKKGKSKKKKISKSAPVNGDDDSDEDWGGPSKGEKKASLKKNYHGVDQWNSRFFFIHFLFFLFCFTSFLTSLLSFLPFRFQDILSHFHSSSVDERAKIKTKVKASEELTFLSQDFIHAAKTFGKIIISEVFFFLSFLFSSSFIHLLPLSRFIWMMHTKLSVL